MAPAEADVPSAGLLRIDVAFCPVGGRCDRVELALPAGSTLRTALVASGLLERHDLKMGELQVGVWSRIEDLAHPLRDRDRVEIYRPLTVDPMDARRRRQQLHRQRLQRRATAMGPAVSDTPS